MDLLATFYVLLAFGFIGYVLMLLRFEVVPILMGLILGPMLEENFRRTLLLSRGDFAVFVQRPISATALAVCAGLIIWSVWSYIRGKGGVPDFEELIESERTAAPAREAS